MRWAADLLIILPAVVLAVTGLAVLLDPVRALGRSGSGADTPAGRALLRTVIGGPPVAAAGALAAAVITQHPTAVVWVPSVLSVMVAAVALIGVASLVRERTTGDRRARLVLLGSVVLAVLLFVSHVVRLSTS